MPVYACAHTHTHTNKFNILPPRQNFTISYKNSPFIVKGDPLSPSEIPEFYLVIMNKGCDSLLVS